MLKSVPSFHWAPLNCHPATAGTLMGTLLWALSLLAAAQKAGSEMYTDISAVYYIILPILHFYVLGNSKLQNCRKQSF